MRSSHPSLPILLAIAVLVALAVARSAAIRERAMAGLGEGMPAREAALARGFVLGEDDGLDPATKEDFIHAGLSHLTAVSGENVTLLALLAMPVLAAFGIPLRERLVWVIGLIALYVPLAGSGPSIQRAGVMGAAGLVATLTGRRASRLYALGLALVVTVAIDPGVAGDAGWQLSFAAVLGILLLATPIRGWLVGHLGHGRWRRALAEGIAVTVAATLATAPLIAFVFEEISLTSLAANVLVLPAVPAAMWLGMVSAALAQVPGIPLMPLNGLDALLLAYIAQVAAWCGRPSWAVLHVHVDLATMLATYAAMAAAIALGAHLSRARRLAAARAVELGHPWVDKDRPRSAVANERRPRFERGLWLGAAATLLALLGAAVLLSWPHGSDAPAGPPPGLRVEVLDVGQGDAILLQPRNAPAVLVDGGPPGDELVAMLRDEGVSRLGAAIVTHDQSDHAAGIAEALGRLPIARLVYGRLDPRFVVAARAAGAHPEGIAAGGTMRSGSLQLEVLWPPPTLLGTDPPDTDPNELGLVIRARWHRFTMLLTADAEAEATPLDPGPIDVLKVAHHGSDDAGLGPLLDRIRPRLAVISVGADNPYGHPTAGTLATLATHHVPTLRTDLDGTIEIDVGHRSFSVRRLGLMPAEMHPLYLISGTDGAKIEATRQRLRSRAEREGGAGALEVFEPSEGRGAPDHEALLAAIPAMSLMGTRRYLLADGVEKWRDKQQGVVAEAIGKALPPNLTLVLIARAKAPTKLLKAVKAAKGEIHNFEAPKARDMPRVLVADAQRLGFRLDPAAARLLVERMGPEPLRLHNELERLALWAGENGQVGAVDIEEMIADTSEAAVWTLSDAVIEGDARTALRVGEQLVEQGENVTGLIYGLASRLRAACAAAALLEEGRPPREVESQLKMHPYAAKQLVARLGDADLSDLRLATEALAQLERWCRGDADYGDELALTLALRDMTASRT